MNVSKLAGEKIHVTHAPGSFNSHGVDGHHVATALPGTGSPKLSNIQSYVSGNGHGLLDRALTSESLTKSQAAQQEPHRAVVVACAPTMRCPNFGSIAAEPMKPKIEVSAWKPVETDNLQQGFSLYKKDVANTKGQVSFLDGFKLSLQGAGITDHRSIVTPAGEEKLRLMNTTDLSPEVKLAISPISITHEDGVTHKYPLLVVLDVASKQGKGLPIDEAYRKENTDAERRELEMGIANLIGGVSVDFDRKGAYRELIKGMRLPTDVKKIVDIVR